MKRKILPWVLVILWMALIFFFSHQVATESNELSTGIISKIVNIISKVTPSIEINEANLNHIIRKAAHFTIYLILGILVTNALKDGNKSKLNLILASLVICILYAISDEFHQLFIPGRSGEIKDVILDSLGALLGILMMSSVKVKSRHSFPKTN
ncbi:MAG TPA: VanZ family protein [Clostridiales bacterium]|nr:VanZ family protein [Clostridiales bacterium]